jgi:hypothetical protein
MTDVHYRYLWLEQGIGAAIFNVVVSAGIAWLLFRPLDVVPLWGPQSIAGDTIATCFFLPFLTCLIVTRLAHREVRRGRLPAPRWRRTSHPVLRRLPAGTGRRAVVLGVLGVLLVAPVTIALLDAANIGALGFTGFVSFKALYAGVLGAAVTPVVALAALGDAEDSLGLAPAAVGS